MEIVTAAIVTEGQVTNLVQIDQTAIASFAGAVAIPAGELPQIGWSYADGTGFMAPAPPVLTSGQLLTYAANKWAAVTSGGLTVSGVFVGTDQQGLILLNGAVSLATQVPTQAFSWSVSGGKVALTATQVIAIGIAVGQWFQNTFLAIQAIEAGITAGTITTAAQIDAYVWPVS